MAEHQTPSDRKQQGDRTPEWTGPERRTSPHPVDPDLERRHDRIQENQNRERPEAQKSVDK